MGTGNLPSGLNINQNGDSLTVKKTFVEEYTDNRIIVDHLILNGTATTSQMFNSPVTIKADWKNNSDTLVIVSNATFKFGDRTFEMNSDEQWTLQDNGRILSIEQASDSFRGKRKITMIFNKVISGWSK